jgi:membrane glycosyltransferase
MLTSNKLPGSEAHLRRALLLTFILLIFSAGLCLMLDALRPFGVNVVSAVTVLIFAILFAQLTFGFVLAATGWWILRGGGDPMRISKSLPQHPRSGHLPNTAIVIPIYNEDVERVFAGLKLMFESLHKTGAGENFDFFVLSDSNDANYWVEEEKAWLGLCKDLNGFGRIFYRKRRVTLNHKSGNIADFCRRWGAHYRYMIVADADSVMTGELLVKLVRLMEANPSTGIIQTNPRLVLGKSLFRRIQQFSAWMYGPLFLAGANFWQLDAANYWGHNAILRMSPFVKFCALPELVRGGPLKGRILSHDTVEAALMRRAGYNVWVAYDLEGSYEEAPPHLPAMLARDRRWCQGNMQHLFVLFWPGLHIASRLHILLGILSYGSAPLWLGFMILSGWLAMHLVPATGRSSPRVVHGSLILFLTTLLLLFLPKILGVWHFHSAGVRKTNPTLRVAASFLLEALFSALLAPVLMLFHTRFVICALTGLPVSWNNQNRREDLLSWMDALTVHWGQMAIGLAATCFLLKFDRPLLIWALPVIAGLLLAVPLSRWTSSVSAGRKARAVDLFLIPEESLSPPELQALEVIRPAPVSGFFQAPAYAAHHGLLQAILDPYVHSIHVSLLRLREQISDKKHDYLQQLGEKLLVHGPEALSAEERTILLWEPEALILLHKELWFAPNGTLAKWWEDALRHYNETSAISVRRSIADHQSAGDSALQNNAIHVT